MVHMEDNNEDFRIDIIDFFIMELDKRINQDKGNELLQRIRLHMTSHKSNCMEYIYTNNKIQRMSCNNDKHTQKYAC